MAGIVPDQVRLAHQQGALDARLLWKPRWLVHEEYTTPATTDLRIELVEKPSPGSYDLRLAR